MLAIWRRKSDVVEAPSVRICIGFTSRLLGDVRVLQIFTMMNGYEAYVEGSLRRLALQYWRLIHCCFGHSGLLAHMIG